MFFASCPKCSFKSISVGCFRCFRCDNETAINTGVGDNDNPAHGEVVDTRHNDAASGSRNRLIPSAPQTGEIIASTASSLQNSQNDSAPSKISDFGVLVRESVSSMDNILAVPGPSNLSNVKSNLRVEKLQSGYAAKIQSILIGGKIACFCGVCNEDIAETNAAHRGAKCRFKCCVCTYITMDNLDLQKHSFIHCPKETCKICAQEYLKKDLHEIKHTCKVCKKVKRCKTLLDHHSVKHHESSYFQTHCWICYGDFSSHSIEIGDKIHYICCICGYENEQRGRFKVHNNTHRPDLFCKICQKSILSKI